MGHISKATNKDFLPEYQTQKKYTGCFKNVMIL